MRSPPESAVKTVQFSSVADTHKQSLWCALQAAIGLRYSTIRNLTSCQPEPVCGEFTGEAAAGRATDGQRSAAVEDVALCADG